MFSGSSRLPREEIAQNARWLVHQTTWGYLTTLDAHTKVPVGDTLSFSDGALDHSTGRFFFYVMGDYTAAAPQGLPCAFTLSQASLMHNATLDPEDPRCAKLTASGILRKSEGEDVQLGKEALFARHPQMKHWPASHHFAVHELQLSEVWMIDMYGGGENISLDVFWAAQPRHTTPWAASSRSSVLQPGSKPPPWSQLADRARWLVAHSVWAALGTSSVRRPGMAWGNVRSVADGVGTNSTGLPMLYVPTPDPSSADLAADARAVLTMSEAGLPAPGSGSCGETEDPICARITLSGRLRVLNATELLDAEERMKVKHPLAPWLATGGAHTGGQYFTIELENITFLDFYGGPSNLTVAQYLAAAAPQETCSRNRPMRRFGTGMGHSMLKLIQERMSHIARKQCIPCIALCIALYRQTYLSKMPL
ncbi:unnamed protein product [Durusdinium trenchii]|uniref:CREG-like beta-barrel domain-containing protein n=1 Tax=Durusdinium trenchii TaxID=1381693 RepID=A0ABP0P4N4_9DINO